MLQTDYFDVTPPAEGGGVRLADIVFLMDNSGSMSEEIAAVSANVYDFVDALEASGVDYALGLTRFGQSSGSGNPIFEDGGQLTEDATYFKDVVWNRNNTSGSREPGYYAITETQQEFAFRPGAQRIFIIVTDESPNQGGASLSEALGSLVNSSTTLFALASSSYYGQFTPLTEGTGGEVFNIFSPFESILDAISEDVANSYVVRYRSSNPSFDGTERLVRVEVTAGSEAADAERTYVPGAAPEIVRTSETVSLSVGGRAEGTPLTIEADVTDAVDPGVEGVRLYYRTTETPPESGTYVGTGPYSVAPMVPVGGTLYRGVIPGSAVVGPGVDYYITATDGVSTTSAPSLGAGGTPYQVAVLPNEVPSIVHEPVTEGVPGIPIPIRVTATDATNSLATVQLHYRKTGTRTFTDVLMTSVGGDAFEAEIPASEVTVDGVDYYVRAVDDLGTSSTHPLGGGYHQVEIRLEPSYGTTVITHGLSLESFFNFDFETDNGLGVDQHWAIQMGREIMLRAGNGRLYVVCGDGGGPRPCYDGSHEEIYKLGGYGDQEGGEQIIVFDWLEESGRAYSGFSEGAANTLVALLIQGATEGKWTLDQLHMIGHSRGAVVMSEAIQRLGVYGANPEMLPPGVTIDNTIHFTPLDPHPWDRRVNDHVGDPFSAEDHSVNEPGLGLAGVVEPYGVICWSNVGFADSYWQDGEGLKNLAGLPVVPGCPWSINLSPDPEDNSLDHEGVHAWYHGTVIREAEETEDDPVTDGNGKHILADWYPVDGSPIPSGLRTGGYNRSQTLRPPTLNEIETIPTLSGPSPEADKSFKPRMLFNWDLSHSGGSVGLPGWRFQGGDRAMRHWTGDQAGLTVNVVHRDATSNWTWVPNDATYLHFHVYNDNRVGSLIPRNAESTLVVEIIGRDGTNTAGSVTLIGLTDGWEKVPLPSGLGARKVRFTLVPGRYWAGARPTIRNIGFEKRETVTASLARSGGPENARRLDDSAPTTLHAYDGQGRHTGFLTDSTFVVGIPGSSAIYGADDAGTIYQQIILPPAEGDPYRFETETPPTAEPAAEITITLLTEDDKRRTVRAVYEDVPLAPGALTMVVASLPRPNLSIDADGDGTFETDLPPSHVLTNRTVTVTAEGPGEASPLGDISVLEGGNIVLAFTPNPGAEVADVLVDGVSVGSVGTYTFDEVEADHDVEVTFAPVGSALAFSDYDADPTDGSVDARGEFAEIQNVGSAEADLDGLTLAVFDPYSEKVTYAAQASGTLAPGATYSFANVVTGEGQAMPAESLDDGPGAFALLDGSASTGQSVSEVLAEGSVVAAVVYLNDDEVFGQVGGGSSPSENAQELMAALARLYAVAGEESGTVDLTVTVAPNPATSTAAVSFGVAETGPARVALFDALGREVAVLADTPLGAGRHRVELPTASLPAGVYAVRVVAGAEVHTARLTIVK